MKKYKKQNPIYPGLKGISDLFDDYAGLPKKIKKVLRFSRKSS